MKDNGERFTGSAILWLFVALVLACALAMPFLYTYVQWVKP